MVIPTLIATILTQSADDRPRIRETLDNGVKILAEKNPQVNGFAFAIFCSDLSMPATPETHGQRHLVEHLVAKGHDGLLDRKLEIEGASLTATTTYDGTLFVIRGPRGKEGLGITALMSLIKPLSVKPEAIAIETAIIAQEAAVRPEWAKVFDSGWQGVFAQAGLDTFGNLNVMSETSPSQIELAHRLMFDPQALSIVAYGELEPSVMISMVKSSLEGLEKFAKLASPRPVARYVGETHSRGEGDCRLSVVPGFGRSTTTATIAVAQFLANQGQSTQVVFPFSTWPTAVGIWSSESGGLDYIDKIEPDTIKRNIPSIKASGAAWANGLTADPSQWASNQAILLSQDPTMTFEMIKFQVAALTEQQIMEAFESFQTGKCIQVEGR